jgi:hypothetical protein
MFPLDRLVRGMGAARLRVGMGLSPIPGRCAIDADFKTACGAKRVCGAQAQVGEFAVR